jgi:hypothetical protein
MKGLASERFGYLTCLIAIPPENNNTSIVIFHGKSPVILCSKDFPHVLSR